MAKVLQGLLFHGVNIIKCNAVLFTELYRIYTAKEEDQLLLLPRLHVLNIFHHSYCKSFFLLFVGKVLHFISLCISVCVTQCLVLGSMLDTQVSIKKVHCLTSVNYL